MKRLIPLLAGVMLLAAGCSTPQVASKPVASPAAPLKQAAATATTAARAIDDESANVTAAAGWFSQVVAGLPAELQATTQAKIESLVATATHLSAIAATLRTNVAAPVNAGAKQSDDLAKKLDAAVKRADAAEKREQESFAASLRAWAIAAAVVGTLALAGAVWLVMSGNIKGATGVGAVGLTLYGGAAALNFLAAYWVWIGVACGVAVAGLAAYVIWCRIKLEHSKIALQAIIPAVQEAGQAVRPLIAKAAADAGVSRIVEKVVTDIKHAGAR